MEMDRCIQIHNQGVIQKELGENSFSEINEGNIDVKLKKENHSFYPT